MGTILISNENHCQLVRAPVEPPRLVERSRGPARTLAAVLVVSRFAVPAEQQDAFRRDLDRAVAALGACAGFRDADAGRNVDDPELWVLVTRWADVGSYRRALSSYDVKVAAVPLLSRALDEPSAYEPVDRGELNRNVPR